MKPLATLRKALTDPGLFGAAFGGDTWHAWRTLLLAIAGEPLTADELVTFQALTKRDTAPTAMVEEFLGVIGRRGGNRERWASCRHGSRGYAPMTRCWPLANVAWCC